MTADFVLTVTDQEQDKLKKLARWAIAERLAGRHVVNASVPVANSPVLQKELGAFVTLTLNGQLRGCIGNVVGDGPLYLTVVKMAQAAAFEDPRFHALSLQEFEHAEVEISIMGPVLPCRDTSLITVGRHGLIVRKGAHSGLLLPQVAVEWGWNAKQFLEQTCVKAGLSPAVLQDSDTEIYWFEAFVF